MKLLGLLGYPLSHSFSPMMINSIARKKDWDCAYFAYSIAPQNVEDFVKAAKLLPIDGFNVTTPYKQTILKFCDELSPEAQVIGAANTIINHSGRLTACNTDVYGFKFALENFLPKNVSIKAAVIIGAGGAAKAVLYVLSKIGCKYFYVVTRKTSTEKEWKNDSASLYHQIKINFIQPEMNTLKDLLLETNLIIQATPVGMFPDIDNHVPFPFHSLNHKHFIYDLVYNPPETQFVTLAKNAGANAKNGLDMLAAQAVKSLGAWGYTIDTNTLFEVLREQMHFKNMKDPLNF